MTSPEPRPEPTPTTTTSSRAAEPTSPSRPPNAADAALFDAIATAQASIYGYGIVSAHTVPETNYLVSSSMAAAPQTARGGLGDAGSPIGGRPTACGRLPVADRGRQPHRCREPRGADGGGRRRRVASRRRAGDRRTGARVRGQRADGLRGQGGAVEPRSGHRRRSRSPSPAAPNSSPPRRADLRGNGGLRLLAEEIRARNSAPSRCRPPRFRPGSPEFRRRTGCATRPRHRPSRDRPRRSTAHRATRRP